MATACHARRRFGASEFRVSDGMKRKGAVVCVLHRSTSFSGPLAPNQQRGNQSWSIPVNLFHLRCQPRGRTHAAVRVDSWLALGWNDVDIGSSLLYCRGFHSQFNWTSTSVVRDSGVVRGYLVGARHVG